MAVIEYQGEQHYEPQHYYCSNKMSPKELLELIQKRDNIKRIWCRENNILQLEIPFWEFDNIEKLVDSFLERFQR